MRFKYIAMACCVAAGIALPDGAKSISIDLSGSRDSSGGHAEKGVCE